MPVSLNWATPSASTTYITNENKGKIDTLSAARTRRLYLQAVLEMMRNVAIFTALKGWNGHNFLGRALTELRDELNESIAECFLQPKQR